MEPAKYLRALDCESARARGDVVDLTTCFLQLGDGTTTDRLTPVAVAGFGSGVVNVALGFVRLLFEMPVPFWWLLCVRCRVSGMLFVL